jgi:hypothetical protein
MTFQQEKLHNTIEILPPTTRRALEMKNNMDRAKLIIKLMCERAIINYWKAHMHIKIL